MRELPERADAVVVGAGIAGLVAAAFLGRAGLRPLVLEANHQVGGLMAGIRRKGYVFDCGDQSFEDAGMLFPILEQLGIDPARRLHRTRHRIVGPDFDYPVTGLDVAERAMIASVPEEEAGVRALFDELRRLEAAQGAMGRGRVFAPALRHEEFPAAGRRLLGWFARHGLAFERAAKVRFEDLVARHVQSPAVRHIMGRSGYRDMSALMASGLWYSWCHDYWYPRGGMQSFVEDVATAAREAGATIRLRTPVAEMLEEGGRFAGVRTADGAVVRAERGIWAADARTLFGAALPAALRETPRARRVRQARPSDPMVSLYLGLAIPPDELEAHLQAHHVFHFPFEEVVRTEDRPDDPDVHRDLWLQWNAPILHGEPFAPAGHSAVVLQAFSDHAWMDRWGTGGRSPADLGEAGRAAYRSLKEQVADGMLEAAARLIPGVRERVAYRELGSPIALTRFTGNAEGSTAGWTFAPGGKPFRAPGADPHTGLPGLWLGGQWAIWPGGVPFAAMSAKLAAELAVDGWPTHIWRLLTGKPRETRLSANEVER